MLRTGIFGNTNAITQCTSVDFALEQCPTNSQAGLITIYANYKGDPHQLMGTAPLYDLVPRATARPPASPSYVPILDIPISIPVAVRTAATMAFVSPFKTSPSWCRWRRPPHLLGISGRSELTTPNASRRAPPGNPAGCPGLADTSCIAGAGKSQHLRASADRQPDHLQREALSTTLEVQTYQDPGHLSEAHDSYPATTGCEKETFKPVLYASPTTEPTDSPSGLNVELERPQFEGFAASPSEIRSRP